MGILIDRSENSRAFGGKCLLKAVQNLSVWLGWMGSYRLLSKSVIGQMSKKVVGINQDLA